MVQHDSKWDRKAKTRYLRKHGLKAEDVQKSENRKGSQENPSSPKALKESSPPQSPQEAPQEELVSVQSEPLPQLDPLADEDEVILRQFRQAAAPQKTYGDHVEVVTDTSLFEQAEAGVAQSKLNSNVRRRLGHSVDQPELDSDSDFDAFMDELPQRKNSLIVPDAVEVEKLHIDDAKQKFLDELLG